MRKLKTEDGKRSRSTNSGELQVTNGSQPLLVSALVVPNFKDNLISVGQQNISKNVLFTSNGVYLHKKATYVASSKLIGQRSSDNLYTIPQLGAIGQISLHAAPVTI